MKVKSIHIGPGLFDKSDFVIRHLIILGLALLFGSLATINNGYALFVTEWYRNVGFNFLFIATIWNGNILLMDVLAFKIEWERNLKRSLFTIAGIAVLWPVICHYAFNLLIFPLIHGHPCALNSRENIIFLIIAVAITLLVNSIFTAIAFFNFWRDSIKEKEELKRESITAEFATLKIKSTRISCLTPSIPLPALIEESPVTASDFVQKLSSVYRYLLTQKDKELVTLREEIQFIESYIYLNKIRFGKNLHVDIHIPDSFLNQKIVTLSLQMLVENAIKHNVISGDHPLYVTIEIEHNKVMIKNNLQPKLVMNDSNGIGLNNIVHRYSLLTDDQVEIINDNTTFMVALPLLSS